MFRPTRNSSSLRIRWTWSSDPLHLFYRYIIHPIIYLFTEIKTKGAIHRAVCGSFCVMGRGKIEISKVSGRALAAEICTGPHNRLLRRQHCSSLCSQSEGHKHVANIASALGHIFVGFLAVFGRRNIRAPSLCKQSELQCFAPGLHRMFARCPLLLRRKRLATWSKTAQRFFCFF